ncbi:hypothetical protein C0674_10975 [Sporolactobacillus terrae]|uniref:Uncharacterized protein n=1 Tax=Sporolactobacillus terrae TaxID=269673 RepID=A0ABX5Q8Z3_9BACL|nr:hypothetical protein C0674_10975 [Sporolactobacillus terrae]QAA26080.1 hypothetical protein C0679_10955 [Sporolactobacillus terrae]
MQPATGCFFAVKESMRFALAGTMISVIEEELPLIVKELSLSAHTSCMQRESHRILRKSRKCSGACGIALS